MSGLSVLKVLATVVDLFKMFNSTIGTFHRTEVDALQRSSLAGRLSLLKLSLLSLRPKPEYSGLYKYRTHDNPNPENEAVAPAPRLNLDDMPW